MRKGTKITTSRQAISVSFTDRTEAVRLAFMRLAQEKFGRSGAELMRDLVFAVVAIYEPEKLAEAGQRDRLEPSILMALLDDWRKGKGKN